MNIKKIYSKNNATKLLVKGVDEAFINAIRRSIMTNVPVLAIETIHIYQNSSVLFDEYLGSRLGLLPLKTDTKSYKKGDKVKLMLDEVGPKTIYSKDIQCTDPNIEVAFKNIPIVKLSDGQSVKLEMEAEMNTGKEHTKYQPALVSYHQIPEIKTKKKSKKIFELAKLASKNSVEIKGGKIVLKDPIDRYQIREIIEADKDGLLELDFKKNSFVLIVEPFGFIDTKEILCKAAEALEEKSKKFEKELKKIK